MFFGQFPGPEPDKTEKESNQQRPLKKKENKCPSLRIIPHDCRSSKEGAL